jgi:hypothetical protein
VAGDAFSATSSALPLPSMSKALLRTPAQKKEKGKIDNNTKMKQEALGIMAADDDPASMQAAVLEMSGDGRGAVINHHQGQRHVASPFSLRPQIRCRVGDMMRKPQESIPSFGLLLFRRRVHLCLRGTSVDPLGSWKLRDLEPSR